MRFRSLLLVGVAPLALSGCETEEAEWVPVPYNLCVTAFARDLIRLKWDGSPDVEGYLLERKTGAGAFELLTEIGDPWTTWYPDHTVVQDTTYSYRVKAFRYGLYSDPSNVATATAEDYYVTVLVPDGSENLALGDVLTIEWETNWSQFDARIDLSVNNGAGWINILHAWGPETSPWQWRVGGLNTTQDPYADPYWEQCIFATSTECLISITDYEQGAPTDESDQPFTITVTRSVTVDLPNGAESWTAGASENITWTQSGVTDVRIELSRDNGGSWEDIVATTGAAAGSCGWTVEGPASAECLVRVRDAANELPEDASDATFTITVP